MNYKIRYFHMLIVLFFVNYQHITHLIYYGYYKSFFAEIIHVKTIAMLCSLFSGLEIKCFFPGSPIAASKAT